MGTRADFYVGRGIDAEWLGSIAWDGYPEGIDSAIRRARDHVAYCAAVAKFFTNREDVTRPEQGWPWPWKNSQTTDYSYAFDSGTVYASNYGHAWWPAFKKQPTRESDEKVTFPDMSARQRVTFGQRSGVMVVGVNGPIDNLE